MRKFYPKPQKCQTCSADLIEMESENFSVPVMENGEIAGYSPVLTKYECMNCGMKWVLKHPDKWEKVYATY
jgi:DNA-directed RNA polymerase subunit RPC12/RpoP